AQSTRMPLESVYCSSNAAGARTFLTSASSCTSPKAPRLRLSPSSSCRLTTLPVRLSIFFWASSMVARRCITLTKVSLVFLKPSSRRRSTLPAIWSRRWSILTESRSLESARFLPRRSPCCVNPSCRSFSISRCFCSSTGPSTAPGSRKSRSGIQHAAREPEHRAREPDPAVPDEIELEHARGECPADRIRAERAEEPCDRAEHSELCALRRKHLGATRPQRAHHRRLVGAL